MKVAYMLGSINRGGMETLLLDLFRSHESVPYEMICFYRKGGQYSEVFQNSAVPMIPLTPRFGFDPSYILTLRRALLKAKVDVVHAQQSLDLLYAKLATLGTGIKVIQTYHGYDFGANKTTKRLMQWAAKMSDLNIYVSEHQKNDYLSQYGLPANP